VEVQGDRPQDLGEDNAVETDLGRCLNGDRGVNKDVVVKGVAAESEKH
jgi:hypothetical protein